MCLMFFVTAVEVNSIVEVSTKIVRLETRELGTKICIEQVFPEASKGSFSKC